CQKFCHPLSPKGMSHKMSRKCRTHSEEASVRPPRRSCCGSAHGLYAACRRSGRQLPCRQQPFPLVAEQLCMGDGPGGVGAPAAVLLLRPDAAVAAPLPAGELRTSYDPGELLDRVPIAHRLPLDQDGKHTLDPVQPLPEPHSCPPTCRMAWDV